MQIERIEGGHSRLIQFFRAILKSFLFENSKKNCGFWFFWSGFARFCRRGFLWNLRFRGQKNADSRLNLWLKHAKITQWTPLVELLLEELDALVQLRFRDILALWKGSLAGVVKEEILCGHLYLYKIYQRITLLLLSIYYISNSFFFMLTKGFRKVSQQSSDGKSRKDEWI